MDTPTEKNEISRLINIIENLNARLSAIETSGIQLPPAEIQEPEAVPAQVKETSEDLEFRIGEQWFGKIGIIAFTFAFFYLLTLSFGGFAHTAVMLLGFAVSAVIIGVSFHKKEQLKSLSGYLTGSGLIILFFSSLKLHYFTATPVVLSGTLMSLLLFFVSAGAGVITVRRMSPYLMMVTFLFFGSSALLSDSTPVILLTLVFLSAAVVQVEKRYKWNNLVIFAIPLTYIFYFLWFMNNPLSGREIVVSGGSPALMMFVPVYMSIYGFSQARKDSIDDYGSSLKALLNCLFGYLLFVFITLMKQDEYSALLNAGMALLLLAIASRYWILQKSKISTFLYSMAGYGALSFAIVLNYHSPASFILLCWQSLLVVSTALWFRSRFIVVANFFIFFVLLLAFVLSGQTYNVTSLSFGLVALISARLINIHQQRLELQSEQLRNAYLIIATVYIPYILYLILPASVVGISWIILAFTYYVVGKLINNKKYRLMASGTLIMSLAYIFIFGLTSGEALYKILSFLLVSVALVIISVVYTKVRTREMSK